MYMVKSNTAPALVVARRTTNGTAMMLSANNPASAVLNYPAGSSSGDLLLLQVTHTKGSASPARTVTLTGGATWNLISGATQTDNTNALTYYYYWTFRGSETSVTVTPTDVSFGKNIGLSMVAYDGATVNATTPVVYLNGTYNAASGTALSTSGTVAAGTGKDVVLFHVTMQANNTVRTTTWSGTGVTEIDDQEFYNSSVAIDHGFSIAVKTNVTPGATGTMTATAGSNGLLRTLAAFVVQP